MESHHRLIAFDETPLFYRKISPTTSPRAVVFLIHGMGEHGGRYALLGEFLASMGFECWIPDLRGFGQSGGQRGFARDFSDFQSDLEAVYSLAERTHQGLPFFLLGHSFGGLVVAKTASCRRLARLKGLILSSPLFGVAMPVPAWQKILAFMASGVAPAFSQHSHVQWELLTHDEGMRKSHAEDPLIHFQITARLYTEILGTIAQSSKIAANLFCPALILQAGEDKIVSVAKTQAFFSHLSSQDKELEIYDGWYHEILNETGRQAVFARIGQWLFKHS